ncbi:hypothetical protein B7P34_17720 [Streptosporangium nondiastaticum]|uniref:HTH hxlR-type domain-containing protein n=1 Tax=Streptosporangium nondiastaticum TaxID=35764 RepID=A0A9X7JPD7_9ACTN|nr:hypothetical protein B7P34_17720 [Streptosporangium nondiastaticum]
MARPDRDRQAEPEEAGVGGGDALRRGHRAAGLRNERRAPFVHLLDGRGVAERIRTAGWPPAVRYELTPRGRALGPVLQALWDWGEGASPQPPGGSSGGPSRGSSQGSPRQPAEW